MPVIIFLFRREEHLQQIYIIWVEQPLAPFWLVEQPLAPFWLVAFHMVLSYKHFLINKTLDRIHANERKQTWHRGYHTPSSPATWLTKTEGITAYTMGHVFTKHRAILTFFWSTMKSKFSDTPPPFSSNWLLLVHTSTLAYGNTIDRLYSIKMPSPAR